MHDQIELPLAATASCPQCDSSMEFVSAALVAGHGGVVDRFACAPCGITRLRPRRKIGRSYFEMLSAAVPPRACRAAMIRIAPAPAFGLAQS